MDREPRGLGLDQRVAPGGRLDGATLGEDVRPSFAGDLQEFERELPIAVEIVGHEFIKPVPRHVTRGHIVDEAREIVGERERRGRIVGDEWSLAQLVGLKAGSPSQHLLRQQHAPFEPADRWQQVERVGGERAGRRLREGDLVLVDVADGDDARQDGRAGSGHVEEDIAHQPTGAPRGQIEGGVCKREGIVRGGKAGHEPPIDERSDQRRHERRRSRNGEDSGGSHAELYTAVLRA